MRKQKIRKLRKRKRTRTRTKKRKKRVVGEMRVVKGKHLARNPRGTVFEVCGIKLSHMIDTPLDRGGSREENNSQVVFLI